jgi:hypothetical protein
LLIIPNPNIEGAFNNRKEERTESGKLVDPAFDFNYGIVDSDYKCFQTSTARLLAHIYKEYLIIGTLVLSHGKEGILFPFGSKFKNEKQKSKDQKAFISIAEKLSDSVSDDLNLNIHRLLSGSLSTESKGQGRFEDWVYASSEDIQNVDINCFDSKTYLKVQNISSKAGLDSSNEIITSNKDLMALETTQQENEDKTKLSSAKEKDLLKQFLVLTSSALSVPLNSISHVKDLMKMSLKLLVPSQFSNRSFVYKLTMGNENEISYFPTEEQIKAKKKPYLRKRAYNTRTMKLLKNFAYFSKKKLSVKDLNISEDNKSLIMKVKVEGCLEINDIKLEAQGLSLSFSKDDIQSTGLDFIAKLKLKSIRGSEINSFTKDFTIFITCDYEINDDQKPISNLIRSKLDPNYLIYQSKYVWSSTRYSKLHIHNFDSNLLKQHKEKSDKFEDMLHQQSSDLVSLVKSQKFFAYIKDGFYLLFDYDYQMRKIVYKIENIDEKKSAKNIRFEDFTWEIKYYYENFDYSTANHEQEFSLNEEFFHGSVRSLEGYFSLLGKSLHVISNDQTNFYSTKSLIRVYEKDSNFDSLSGLPIPPEGLNCFSNKLTYTDVDAVYYITIFSSSSSADLHEIYFYTLRDDLQRVRIEFFDRIIPLYKDITFNGYGHEKLSKFSKYIGVLEKNELNLLGQKISIKYGYDVFYQDCHLGRRNPFYDAKDVLKLWSEKNKFYQDITEKSKSSSNLWIMFMVALFALICVGIILSIKYCRQIKQRIFDKENKPKVEAI